MTLLWQTEWGASPPAPEERHGSPMIESSVVHSFPVDINRREGSPPSGYMLGPAKPMGNAGETTPPPPVQVGGEPNGRGMMLAP